MKKLFVLCVFGLLFNVGCNDSASNRALPVVDASSPEKLMQSLDEVAASVPSSSRKKFDAYLQFYKQWMFSVPEVYEEVAPEINGKNYAEVLNILTKDLLETQEFMEAMTKRMAIAGIPVLATDNADLKKIVITNFKYHEDTHVKEMDIQNNTNKEISALQIMVREDFSPQPNHQRMALFLIDFPLLKPGAKAHVTEKETFELAQQTLSSLPTGMQAVAIQAFDKDKMLVINNEPLMTAMERINAISARIEEINRILQL